MFLNLNVSNLRFYKYIINTAVQLQHLSKISVIYHAYSRYISGLMNIYINHNKNFIVVS